MTTLNQTVNTEPQVPEAATTALHGELYDAHLTSILRRFGRFLRQHPSMILTFGYLLCSVLGMLFSTRLFTHFDFEILPYLELSDFMLAALTHPWILLNVAGWLATAVVLFGLDRYTRRRFRWYALWSEKYYQPSQFQRYNFMFIVIPLLFLYNAAKEESSALANKIKTHQQPMFQVSLIYPVQDAAKTLQLDQAQVIARTSSYLFVYVQQQIKVIPHDNVAALLPVSPIATADKQANLAQKPEPIKTKIKSPEPAKAATPEPGSTPLADDSQRP